MCNRHVRLKAISGRLVTGPMIPTLAIITGFRAHGYSLQWVDIFGRPAIGPGVELDSFFTKDIGVRESGFMVESITALATSVRATRVVAGITDSSITTAQ